VKLPRLKIGSLLMSSLPVTVQSIENAYARLQGVVEQTPLQYSRRLSELYGASIYLKREDLQAVRSYKIRGAYNLMSSLTESERGQGVVCASAGNHAQGVAVSCSQLHIQGRIYMPENTPRQKVGRVRALGGQWISIELVGDTFDDTYRQAAEYTQANGKVFVPPFDDPRIIAGQGTVGIELRAQLAEAPDFLVVPVGGGGLLSGLAVYAETYFPTTQLVGVEPAGAACLLAALAAGHPVTLLQIDTFVDGAAVKTVGQSNFAILRERTPEVITVPEGEVCTEMIALYQSEGIIAEPAGALSVAALSHLGERLRGKTVVCILSGGNNDISRYPEIIERSLIDQGLKHYFLIEFSQRPGALRRYLDEVLGPEDDITLFEYIKKSNREYGPALVGVELARRDDFGGLLARMEMIGLQFELISRDSALFRFVL
jgi:threonine dehydratase